MSSLGSENYGIDGAADIFNWVTLRLESRVGLGLLDDIRDGGTLICGFSRSHSSIFSNTVKPQRFL